MLADKQRFFELLESINGLIELTESEILTMRTNPQYCFEVLEENFGGNKAEVVTDYLFESYILKTDIICLTESATGLMTKLFKNYNPDNSNNTSIKFLFKRLENLGSMMNSIGFNNIGRNLNQLADSVINKDSKYDVLTQAQKIGMRIDKIPIINKFFGRSYKSQRDPIKKYREFIQKQSKITRDGEEFDYGQYGKTKHLDFHHAGDKVFNRDEPVDLFSDPIKRYTLDREFLKNNDLTDRHTTTGKYVIPYKVYDPATKTLRLYSAPDNIRDPFGRQIDFTIKIKNPSEDLLNKFKDVDLSDSEVGEWLYDNQVNGAIKDISTFPFDKKLPDGMGKLIIADPIHSRLNAPTPFGLDKQNKKYKKDFY